MAGRRRTIGKFQRQTGESGGTRPGSVGARLKRRSPSPAQAIKLEQETETPVVVEGENAAPETFADQDIAPDFSKENQPENSDVDPLPNAGTKNTADNGVPLAEENASESDGQEHDGMNDEEQAFITDQLQRKSSRRFEAKKQSSRRKKFGVTAVVLFASVSIFGTVAFLPTLIVKQITSRLTDAFMDRAQYALEQRAEKYVQKYITKSIAPAATCGTTVSSACSVNPSAGMVAGLFAKWNSARLENKLFTNHGLSFSRDVRTNEIKVFKTDGLGAVKELGSYGENTVTKEVIKIVKQETNFDGVVKRRHIRSLLSSKYGAKKWCIIACNKRDDIVDFKISALQRFKVKIIERVVGKFSAKGAAYLLCFVTDCSPDAINREASRAVQNIVSKIDSEAMQKIIRDTSGKTFGRYIAEQLAIKVVGVIAPNVSAQTVISAVPVVGWIYAGLTVFDMVDVIDEKINDGQMNKYVKDIREQSYVDYGNSLLSAADDVTSFDASLADRGAVAQLFYGFNKSRVWQSINNTSPKSTEQCEDDVVLQGENDPLVCPELTVNPGTGIDEIWNLAITPLRPNLIIYRQCFGVDDVPFVGCAGIRLKSIIHGAISGINWAVGGIFSGILGFISNIPGIGSVMDTVTGWFSKGMMWVMDAITSRLFKTSVDASAQGGKAATQFAGFYDVTSNQFLKGHEDIETGEKIGIGAMRVDPEQEAALDKAIAEEKRIERKTQSLFARYFDLDNSTSLASQTTLALAGNIPEYGGGVSLPTSINVAFIDTFSSIFGITKKSSAALSSSDRSALFGVTQYAVPVGDESLTIDPEELTPEKCEEIAQLREETSYLDPLTGEVEYTMVDTCQLDSVVTDVMTKPYDLDTESAIGTTGDALSGGLIAGTPLPGGDTVNTPCPQTATSGFLRVEPEAYINGQRYTINLCSVHGVQINSVVATAFDNLFTAMKAAGYTINGTYGFRDMASQTYGYTTYGSDTYARPGYSNHQYGAAVDINCQGGGQSYTAGTGRGRDSFLSGVSAYPCLEWVANNSNKYGLLLQCVGQSSDGGEIRADDGGCEWWHMSPTGG